MSDNDLAYVRLLVGTELLGIDFYTRAVDAKKLSSKGQKYLKAALANEKEHYQSVAAILSGASLVPLTAADVDFSYPKAAFDSAASITKLAAQLETAFLGAYLGAAGGMQATSLVSGIAQHRRQPGPAPERVPEHALRQADQRLVPEGDVDPGRLQRAGHLHRVGSGCARESYSVSEAARLLGISVETLRRWDRVGRITTSRDGGNRRMIPATEIDRLRGASNGTALSARNRIRAVVTEVKADGLMAQVEMVVTDPVGSSP